MTSGAVNNDAVVMLANFAGAVFSYSLLRGLSLMDRCHANATLCILIFGLFVEDINSFLTLLRSVRFSTFLNFREGHIFKFVYDV